MIKIEHTQVVGIEPAIRGMRNPMNSWDKSDSYYTDVVDCETGRVVPSEYFIGENDHGLMMSLAKGGPVHAKYRRMINVYVDITAPLYWWKEFDTYKIGTVANSCSTMHKIHSEEFTRDSFSFDEDLLEEEIPFSNEDLDWDWHTHFEIVVDRTVETCEVLRKAHNRYVEASKRPNITDDEREHFRRVAKKYWRMLIQYLPTSYNQKRTIMLNYEVLYNIYHSRKNHKLTEWHTVCDWIKSLPYSEVITGEEITIDEEFTD